MKVLLVEDEKDTAISLRRGLARNGYVVDLAGRGEEALECLAVNAYDLMLLDLNLPDIDGLDVCREAHHRLPELKILILTARDQIDDIVTGLDRGADDYLVKPFHFEEILARMRALLRRDMRCRDPQISVQDIILDPVEHIAWQGGSQLKLTRKEFNILEYLMRHAGEVVSQEDLLEHVWGSTHNVFSNTVRVHIQSLRVKLGDTGAEPRYIKTIIGVGYQLAGSN
jgi:DNA-binding response OmpR family regulator